MIPPVFIKYGLGAAVGVGILFGAYSIGSTAGKNSVQVKWDAERLEVAAENLRLTNEIAGKEKEHREKTSLLVDALAVASAEYAETISTINSEFAQRLSDSETRSSYYRQQASAGPVEAGNLASHAAQLDRSLEQGRQLVKEFGATLRQCETRTVVLGEQILADRTAIGN